MARVTAIRLRDAARAAMLDGHGRGFMRFLPEGHALLATDALRRCADEAACERLLKAVRAAGFACTARCGLLELNPGDAVLAGLSHGEGRTVHVDWESPLHPAQALAGRFLSEKPLPMTDAGRQLVLEALRLTWQGEDRLLSGLPLLRAQAAVMLRSGDRSGMREAGAILAEYCEQEWESGAGRKTE